MKIEFIIERMETMAERNAVREIKALCYNPKHGLRLDLYLPETEGTCPVFVFFHGTDSRTVMIDHRRRRTIREGTAVAAADRLYR